jgi:citrate synthase
MTAPDRWIDAAEAAERLGVKPTTLYSYVSRGLLRRRRHPDGRRSLFDPAEVDAVRRRAHPPRVEGDLMTFESAVTTLGTDRPFFRGRDAIGLAAATVAQQALPATTLPLERLQLVVTTLSVLDPMRFNLDVEAVVATGRAMVAGMVDALPVQSRRRVAGDASIAERLWSKLTAAPADPALVSVLDAALCILADHELAASTVAARVAASVKADPYAVVAAALGVVSGPMHGGASLGAEALIAEVARGADPAYVIGERLRRGERIPGIGHPVYKTGDSRGVAVLDLVRAAAPGHPALAAADALVAELQGRQLPALNIDFAVATMAAVTGMLRGAGETVFAVARTAGWLAHALEEYGRRRPLRPRAVYVGAAPER